jgi:hypothetical protein
MPVAPSSIGTASLRGVRFRDILSVGRTWAVLLPSPQVIIIIRTIEKQGRLVIIKKMVLLMQIYNQLCRIIFVFFVHKVHYQFIYFVSAIDKNNVRLIASAIAKYELAR